MATFCDRSLTLIPTLYVESSSINKTAIFMRLLKDLRKMETSFKTIGECEIDLHSVEKLYSNSLSII